MKVSLRNERGMKSVTATAGRILSWIFIFRFWLVNVIEKFDGELNIFSTTLHQKLYLSY